MSDALREAMKESGLEEFLDLKYDAEPDLSQTIMRSSMIQTLSQPSSSNIPVALPNYNQTTQVASVNQTPYIIRLGAPQSQMVGSQISVITTQCHPPNLLPPGIVRTSNVRQISMTSICQSTPNSINSTQQLSLPSQNGRIIKLISKPVPVPGPVSYVTLLNSSSQVASVAGISGRPLVLSSSSALPLPNAQTLNIRHSNLQQVPASRKPVVQAPVANPNASIRFALNHGKAVPGGGIVANRPIVVHQGLRIPNGGASALPQNLGVLPVNSQMRIVSIVKPGHDLSMLRPVALAQNAVVSRFATPRPSSETVVLNRSSDPTGSKNRLTLPDNYMIANSKVVEEDTTLIVPPVMRSMPLPGGASGVAFPAETAAAIRVSEAPSGADKSKLSTSSDCNLKNDKHFTQANDDKNDIFAALSDLAAFEGLNEDDLGKEVPSWNVGLENHDKMFSLLDGATESQATFSGPGHQINKIPGVQNVVIGEKLICSLPVARQDCMGGPRASFQSVQTMNGVNRVFTPPPRQSNQSYLLVPPPKAEDEPHEEELGHAETFAEYMPTKLKIGCKHPDPVVESASLSSVEAPDVTYALRNELSDEGFLSAVQLESITYACQMHGLHLPNLDRAGFLIGDGAGVGKGRIISGIIYENYLRGRKRFLWVSVSNDLKVDAERDLNDIGAGSIRVHALNKLKYDKISSAANKRIKSGVIFSTYSSLIGESKVNNKCKTRLQQLVKWLSKDPQSVIVFDECHKAKNLFSSSKCTKTGQKVVELQNKLKEARIVYASATGASEPRNMGYMVRLGLWGSGTPFPMFNDFVQAVERRGVGAMEMIAMEMKQRGTYIARQLSFKGVSFRVEEVELSLDFIEGYNRSVEWWVDAREKFQQASRIVQLNSIDTKKMWSQFWSAHQRFFKHLCISSKIKHCVKLCKKVIKEGKTVVIGLQSTGESRMLDMISKDDELDDFVSTAKGVLHKLLESHYPCTRKRSGASPSSCGSEPSPKLNANRKRVLENDSNSRNSKKFKKESYASDDSDPEDGSDDDEDDNDDWMSSGNESGDNPFIRGSDDDSSDEKPVKKEKIQKKRKASSSEDEDEKFIEKICDKIIKKVPDADIVDEALTLKKKLLKSLERLDKYLPPNALDDLIDQLGGPSAVAEMTGRKGRLVSDGNFVRYEKRNDIEASMDDVNLLEKKKFMDGDKLVAIISEAASSGVSLQADRRSANHKKRIHITLELPWSADRAIQQFGRTHRSNQVSAPDYVFLISKLAGERRFASTVAKRLECLGALTHGDRRAAEARDLSQFNIDNKFGQTALDAVLKSIIGAERPLVPPSEDEKKTESILSNYRPSLVGVGLISQTSGSYYIEKDSCNIAKFLNRILGMEVELQNSLFDYFMKNLGKVILDAKKKGKWDLGILDIGSCGELVEVVAHEKFRIKVSEINTYVVLRKISVDRGLSWDAAQKLIKQNANVEDGIYKFKKSLIEQRLLYVLVLSKKNQKNEKWYEIYKPNMGKQPNLLSSKEVKDLYERVMFDTQDVINFWTKQYDNSLEWCVHKYEAGFCYRDMCEVGKRTRIYHVLSGSVLSVWTQMEGILSKSHDTKDSRPQIIRLRTSDNKRIAGMLINHSMMDSLINTLKPSNTGHSFNTNAGPQFPLSNPDLFSSSLFSSNPMNGFDRR